ncbi:GNAT family N-acetyltransferase [Aquiflexum lacus]|uniref:GNAT family N-acetyltransferase n=1 Tax=Aquiflexum lacus TaxID=2483805 RepID=UPI0018935427|nr:GNAT family N-acetyltransferase [Aquiflexum lacus]
MVGITIRQLNKGETPPYALLELADPSRKMIDAYLPHSETYLAEFGEKIIGVFVLSPLDQKETIEIKNIAVLAEFQGKGLGKMMLRYAEEISKKLGFAKLRIATANTSIAQLQLYLSQGFLLVDIISDFFIKNYDDPIFENGVQCRDLMVLEKEIQS